MRLTGMCAAILILTLGASPVSGRAKGVGPMPLLNPGFEGQPVDFPQESCPSQPASGVVPAGWQPYYRCRQPGDPDFTNFAPEFFNIDKRLNPAFEARVRSGDTALKYFNFFARNESAGVYQRVSVTSGDWLRFSLWVQLWTTNCSPGLWDPPLVTSEYEPGNLEARVCIDTDGGALDWDSGTVCGGFARYRAWDNYAQVQVQAQAKSNEVLVILNSRADWPVKHNDVYADDAELHVIAAPPVPGPPPGPARAFLPAVMFDWIDPNYFWPRCPAPPFAIRSGR
jgi:hypothetical protein